MKTISKDELLSKLNSQDLVIVNVLARPAYEKIRIRGSVSIPRSELEGGRWQELDNKKEIVCRFPFSQKANDAPFPVVKINPLKSFLHEIQFI
jgi:hypothetical protein